MEGKQINKLNHKGQTGEVSHTSGL